MKFRSAAWAVLQARQPWLILIFGATACGAIALPMLPIWQATLRVIAVILVWQHIRSRVWRDLTSVILLALLLVTLVYWINEFFRNPLEHLIGLLTDVYGESLGFNADASLFLFDSICIALLVCRAFADRVDDSWYAIGFRVGIAAFWGWIVAGLLVAWLTHRNIDLLSQLMTGSSQWAGWLYFALIVSVLVKSQADRREVLGWTAAGGIVVAAVILGQTLAGDYSYVLDAPNLEDYFYRVRGTYFYHAPATLAVVLAGAALLALPTKDRNFNLMLLVAGAVLIFVAELNNTRAISLALAASLVILLLLSVKLRNLAIVVVALLSLVYIAPASLYLKPISGLASSGGTQAEVIEAGRGDNHGVGDKTSVAKERSALDIFRSMAGANSERIQLLSGGLSLLAANYWFGVGIGNLEIPLDGRAFLGQESTYSTHSLYLDLALMAGIPSLLLFCGIFLLAACAALSRTIAASNPGQYTIPTAVLLGLTLFGIAGLFFPQERNELIGIAFLYAAIGVNPGRESRESVEPHVRQWRHRLYSLIFTMAACWTIVTSPAYVFPVVEIIAKHGSEIGEERQVLATNDPVIRLIAEQGLRIRGVANPRVMLLEDNTNELPIDDTWIVWSPKRDAEYTTLRSEQGYQLFRAKNHAISFKQPPSWWVIESVQPMAVYLYAGAREIITLPLDELGELRLVPNRSPATALDPGKIGKYRSENGPQVYRFLARPGFPESFARNIRMLDYSTGLELPLRIRRLESDSGITEYRIEAEYMPTSDDLALVATLPTWPNQAPAVDADIIGQHRGEPHAIADFNFGTSTTWPPNKELNVVFDFSEREVPPIGIYRMVSYSRLSSTTDRRFSWSVDGSSDGESWQLLDRRHNMKLSNNRRQPSAFLLPNSKKYRFYRIRFSPLAVEYDDSYGLRELELYPLPGVDFRPVATEAGADTE